MDSSIASRTSYPTPKTLNVTYFAFKVAYLFSHQNRFKKVGVRIQRA